jgi:hypothetical protein
MQRLRRPAARLIYGNGRDRVRVRHDGVAIDRQRGRAQREDRNRRHGRVPRSEVEKDSRRNYSHSSREFGEQQNAEQVATVNREQTNIVTSETAASSLRADWPTTCHRQGRAVARPPSDRPAWTDGNGNLDASAGFLRCRPFPPSTLQRCRSAQSAYFFGAAGGTAPPTEQV